MISPSNGQFKIIVGKYLVGKSDPNSNEFDNLLFACRDIKEISIPSTIRIISPYAFENCSNLTKVEIPPNSNLQIIGRCAFFSSMIKEISIPSKVSKICECSFLVKIEIPPNSNLQTIEADAFNGSKIEEINFPNSLKELKEGWCLCLNDLTKIIISPSNCQFKIIDDKYLVGKSDPNKDEFDTLLFACRDIKEISIPSNIKIISPYAFYNCSNLTKVEIPTNSNLETIGANAFSNTKINKIFIPSKISEISENVFSNCVYLTKVEIPTNSNFYSMSLFNIEKFTKKIERTHLKIIVI